MRAAVVLFAAAISAVCETGQLRIVGRKAVPEIPQRGLIRLWVCPNGLVVVAGGSGELVLLDGGREKVVYHSVVSELAGFGGGGCDDQGVLYFAVHTPEGTFVRLYSWRPQEGLKFQGVFRTTGRIERLLPVGQDLYVVGLARIGSEYVFLRRFRLPEGVYLGSPAVKMPVRDGPELIHHFATQGSLFWHPRHKHVVYVPANPFEFWRLDQNGEVVANHRPPVANFMNATPGARSWNLDMFDRVYNAAALPDGRVVAQILTGAFRPRRQTFLVVLDSDFRLTEQEIPMAPETGLLVGADAEGTLCFADLVMSGESAIVKARLDL